MHKAVDLKFIFKCNILHGNIKKAFFSFTAYFEASQFIFWCFIYVYLLFPVYFISFMFHAYVWFLPLQITYLFLEKKLKARFVKYYTTKHTNRNILFLFEVCIIHMFKTLAWFFTYAKNFNFFRKKMKTHFVKKIRPTETPMEIHVFIFFYLQCFYFIKISFVTMQNNYFLEKNNRKESILCQQ